MESVVINNEKALLDLAETFGSTSTLRRILRTASRLAEGNLVVKKEKNYRCKIYNDEYKNAYSNFFALTPKTCTRLHFLKKNKSGKSKEQYIGNCVLRPRKPASVSYLILPHAISSEHDRYCLCDTSFVDKYEKKNITVKAWPFVQQDGLYDRCAHVALYSINQYLSQKKIAKKMTITQIIKEAKKIPTLSREYPSEGLEVIQIKHILKEMGTSPIVYAYPPREGEFEFPPQRVIYHYIESGLPVLVGVKVGNAGHALVVLGHNFNPDNWWIRAIKEYLGAPPSGVFYHCSTSWIENFIVSDDNLGPYMSVDKNFFEAQAKENLVVIVALPKNVYVKGEDAEISAFKSLPDELINEIANLPQSCSSVYWFQHLWRHLRLKDIVLRTYMLPMKELRRRFTSQSYPAQFKKNIKATPFPDFLWVTELSTPGLFAQSRMYLGLIAIDPTGAPNISKKLMLIRHVPGLLHCRNAKTEAITEYAFENDFPREHLRR